jgi:hypothetical protein
VGANAFDVFDLARRTQRGGQPVLEDPLVADEMVGFLMEIQALTLNGQRTQVPELVADRPQGIPLASKLMGTEMSRRLNDFAVRLTGARGAYYVDEPEAADNGLWARNYLNSFSATIGGGTSQIQANIVETLLGKRQMKPLGINAKFMGGDGICTGELPKLAAGTMADGQVVCAEAGGVSPDKAAGLEEFKKRFKAKFGIDVQLYAPYVYDAVNTMVAAMQKADSTDPKKFLPELAKISYDGITGPIAFDQYGDMKDASLTLFTFKGGKKEQMMVVK